jgi:hypothetical protein
VTLTLVGAFLGVLKRAWEAATFEERNAPARTDVQSVEIAGDFAAGIASRPAFAPVFNLMSVPLWLEAYKKGQPREVAQIHQDSTLAGGSDGDRLRNCILPPSALVISRRIRQLSDGPSAQAPIFPSTRSKLSLEQLAELRAVATGRSLRSLAAEFGVSHETIRCALLIRKQVVMT